MRTRNITLTLEKAREWYNSGSSDLKEVALQAYTREELTIPEWKSIKTFKDACKALGLKDYELQLALTGPLGTSYYHHLEAVFKLDIIRKALNKGWNPKMTEGSIYYPQVRFYPAGNKARENAARDPYWEVKETFKADGQKYSLVGGDYNCCAAARGLGYFGCGCGDVFAQIGLLTCKSREIAQHMSRYFAKEIFEACFAQYIGAYEWV